MIPSPGLRVRVPAKINLHLGVGDVRDDGFHELVTVFHAVSLADEVVARPADGLAIEIGGVETRGVPTDASNLAWRAAHLLAEAAGVPAAAALRIDKHIPVAGGMAGGSADAAGALLACARLWDLDAGPAELAGLAARLGSDVAFPLLGGTALGTGRGETLTPLTTRPRLQWVLALSDGGISAGAAYAELDRQRAAGVAPPPLGPPEEIVSVLADGSAADVARRLGNDLQPAALALRPGLADVLAAGTDAGALAGIVSGSGPTCAFLCADADHAAAVADALAAARVCRAVRLADGPAPGARVVDAQMAD
ncbi:4-(cytidine 5'-diphospho)-2-C-methyl-D-erythritol kinase [Jatrophihabitans endophyticus]|uniref:4-(cytidine 5'-diphospho)-2-C-methyl-D-erythritol kinase n=1 Tax=Jatrophihabitans endophyticus TaxID=1206085 RepID=UPI001A0224B5|nr:4-(cytidine 5'-diphospho)-2-C-methyl-D-erythritol kinase [Jatrophihabitans endophyticus]MBE7189187.1 4-(cytidine 5'-diphospho)-2-C-methyl-D-erythritol kinase [Jatrophihabitans endophyticus]